MSADPQVVEACPECNSAQIHRRQQRDPAQGEGRGWYLCSECRATFDEPRERAPIQGGSSFVSTLRRTDPDDLLGGESA